MYVYFFRLYVIEKLEQEEGNACRKRACLIEFRKIKPTRQTSGFMPSGYPVLFILFFFVSPMV